ncbi:MAG TPA: HAD-IA family hydrolase [Armatimonadota bacterium]|jgi:pyrophosphatase PpaX
MTFLFDLDGTLLDSTDLLLAGYKHTARTHLGLETTDEHWLPHFGSPLRDQMALLSEEQADAMVSTYRVFYQANHDLLLRLYPAVPELLKELKANGHRLGVVTSKLTRFAVRGLELFGIDGLFDAIIGESDTALHKPNPEPVLLALERIGACPADAWMVGDSSYDLLAGRAAGCRTAAALWGPFTRAALEPYSPDLFLDHPLDLLTLAAAA